MSALLETLKYRPDVQGGTTSHEDFNSAEGKFGIPRFNGEATMLPEYTYRVRARAAKEKAKQSPPQDRGAHAVCEVKWWYFKNTEPMFCG